MGVRASGQQRDLPAPVGTTGDAAGAAEAGGTVPGDGGPGRRRGRQRVGTLLGRLRDSKVVKRYGSWAAAGLLALGGYVDALDALGSIGRVAWDAAAAIWPFDGRARPGDDDQAEDGDELTVDGETPPESIPLDGDTPRAMAATGDAVWVVTAGEHRLVRIPTRTGAIDRTAALEADPVAVQVAGGHVWVVHEDRTLRFDPRSLEVTGTVRGVEGVHVAVAASADGTTWLLSADGPNGRLYELDPGDARAVERTQLLGTPTALAAGGDTLWVALDSGRSRIVRLTSSDTEVLDDEVVAETRGPVTALAVGDDHLWAYAAGSGELLRVGLGADPPVTRVDDDAEASTASDSDTGSDTRGGDGPGAAVHGPAALATSGDNVWVVDPGRDELARIGAATAAVVGRPFATGDQPAAVVRAGDALWVALAGERERRVVVSPLQG